MQTRQPMNLLCSRGWPGVDPTSSYLPSAGIVGISHYCPTLSLFLNPKVLLWVIV